MQTQAELVHKAVNAMGAEVGCGGIVQKIPMTNMYACYGACATDGPLIIPSREVSGGGEPQVRA